MSLDISFTQRKNHICPHCGKKTETHTDADCFDSGGNVWYPFLESIGYYPTEARKTEYDWYGMDMVLTKKQAEQAYRFVKHNEVYNGRLIAMLISSAIMEDDDVVVNADW